MSIGVNNILRVASVWVFDGIDEQVNVLHVKVLANATANDAEALQDVAEFMAAAYASPVGSMSTSVDHNRFQVQNVTQGLVYGSLPGDSALNGAESGDPLPPQMTCLLLMNTALSRVQGRIYLPTFGEAENNGGVVASGSISNVGDMGDYLLDPHTLSNGLQLQYIILSSSGSAIFPTSYRVVSRYRTQRRRTAGRGS